MKERNLQAKQTFLPVAKRDFKEKVVVDTFLAADIPLHNLQHSKIRPPPLQQLAATSFIGDNLPRACGHLSSAATSADKIVQQGKNTCILDLITCRFLLRREISKSVRHRKRLRRRRENCRKCKKIRQLLHRRRIAHEGKARLREFAEINSEVRSLNV